MTVETIMCHICGKEQACTLVTGKKIYPHYDSLHGLYFWECPDCGGYVGTHKNSKKHAPLGSIVGQEVKDIRKKIHYEMDPLWQSGHYDRRELYAIISERLDWTFHTAKVRTVAEGNKILEIIRELSGAYL